MAALVPFLALLLAPALQEPPPAEVLLVPETPIELVQPPLPPSTASVRETARNEPRALPRELRAVFTPVGNLVSVRGQEDNDLVGIGLVTGLAGTGDSEQMTRQLVQNLLFTHNVNLDLTSIKSKNVALVRVEATLPPGMKPGRRIDARVSTLGDATSLQGGTLALTELTDITGNVVYGTASGPINVGGFRVEGEGASAGRNSVTVGSLPLGGKVEREVPTRIVSEHGFVYLDARATHSSFGNVVKIADSINALYPGVAQATPDGRSIKVRVPSDLPDSGHVAYVDSILKREIVPENFPRVVISERSGVIVMGEGVRLRPGVVAQGNLTVTIAESPEASQPQPFSGGETAVLPRTDVDVEEEDNGLFLVPGAVTLQEVVEVLNVLGTSPRETITILEAMAQAGLLLAEIQRI